MSVVSTHVSVLVVEDDPGDYGLTRALVRLSGIARDGDRELISWAKTLAEGIASARSNKPDVVLLDLTLPDSAGLETVLTLRDALHDLPIMVLSGYNDSALAAVALRNGAQDYLVKGHYDHEALGRAIRRALVRGVRESQPGSAD